MKGKLIGVWLLALIVTDVTGQQVPDTGYAPPIENPAYAQNQGPLVCIDEGHNNFHTRGDRYLPFARLLERDGYVTAGYAGEFEAGKTLSFNEKYLLLLSDTAWVFNEKTVYKPIKGWSQLAYRKYGRGRVAVSGEAAMFTAQLAGPQQFPAGMNAPYARHNYQLLLNIIHWLDRKQR